VWLLRRDPGLLAVRRAARVTLVACIGFYLCRYVLDNADMAPYALFGAVALGVLSQIPGSPRRRARTLFTVLPVGWVLVTLGTLLSVNTVAAAAGMFVLGFAVSFSGVGGPRLVGLAAGVQLLYILPCFPPYDPGSLGWRLAGLTLAVVLLAVAELVLWPDPTPEPYTAKLAAAVSSLAACLSAVADGWSGGSGCRDRLAVLVPEATDAAEALRPSHLLPAQRPASAGRTDRALTAAAGTARLLLGRTVDLSALDGHDSADLPAAAVLLRRSASCAEAAAAWLRGEGEVPDTDRVAAALVEFRAARAAVSPNGLAPEQLRLGSLALSLGEWTKSMVAAIRIAAGSPVGPDTTPASAQPSMFWYAYRSTPWLWWHRLREHLTPRSVYFQGALRLATALAVARLLAGVLDLSHGFWVLLTILTVLRASASETRSALRPAIVGTVLGSVVAAGLLVVGVPPTAYALVLPLVMLVGFAAGPLLGPGWAQALFTLVIALVFAQVSPVDWRLAEARVVDVLVGAAVGLLIGLVAWPRGGSGEVHRATGTFLAAAADVVRETVAVVTRGAHVGHALPEARAAGLLAEASYALYQTEHHPPGVVDWQSTLVAGHHAVRGAEVLVRTCPTGGLLPCVDPLTASAADVANRYERVADGLLRHDRAALTDRRPDPPGTGWPTDLGQDLYHLADLHVWLDGLREDLGRVVGTPEPSDLRARVARVADGNAS
jgi:Fusaric acid resistance protein-like